MAYNEVISRSDAAALIPLEVGREILRALPEASATMALAKRLPNLATNQRRMPVMSALATAYFVTGDNSLKQTSDVVWENKYVDAEELAVIIPIPEAVLDDSEFDIWGEVRPTLVEAFGLAIDQAVLYGTNIPATWTTNMGAAGLKAWCTAASSTLSLAGYTDLYAALLGEETDGTDGVLMTIEADGFMATGHLAHISMRGKLRNTRDSDGNPIFSNGMQDAQRYMIDGAPVVFPLNGSIDSSSSLMFSGQWDQLLYAVRQDVTYKVLDQAVIQDGSGNIVYNLAQQDMVALRAVIRLGFAMPNPINRMQATEASRSAFACLTA